MFLSWLRHVTPRMNLDVLLEKSAMAWRNDVVLRQGDVTRTYGEMSERVRRLSDSFRRLGARPGQRVAILQHNCPQLVETLFGCFRAGLAAVPLNVRLHPKEVSYIVSHTQPSAIVFGEEFRETLGTLMQDGEVEKTRLVCLSGSRKGMLDYEKVISEGEVREGESVATLDTVAWLFYTSGTTGKPKGATLTHRNLLAMTMSFLADVHNASNTDVALHAAPLTHGSGLYLLPFIAKGASNVISDSGSFDPKLLLSTIQTRNVTVLPFLTPTMIKMILVSCRPSEYDLRSLKTIVYGGSPMNQEDLKEAIQAFGRIFVQIYGQGEAPMTISCLRKVDHDPKRWPTVLQSAGFPRTDVEIKIVDDGGHEVSRHQIGEILVRGDVVMQGYWDDPEATSETLTDGWLHTGDLGLFDEYGLLYVVDRKKDMIKSGGSSVYPREVEEVILRHPAVQEVAVVGIPDPVWGESVMAFVVLKPGRRATSPEIIEFCKENIASYKKPKAVEFVESIPKNTYGKVLKRELRDKQLAGMKKGN